MLLNRSALPTEIGAADQRPSDVEAAVRNLAGLAVSKKTRKAVVDYLQTFRVSKEFIETKALGKTSLAIRLQQADSVSASKPIFLRRVVARDGTVYPLRMEITVIVKRAVGSAAAFIHELRWLESLSGQGKSGELAIEAFSQSFHRLVTMHHRKPPHLQTEQDKKINRVLDHLIDWRQFEIENPIEQPLWGKIGKRNSRGYLRVYWIIGPTDEIDKESLISAHNVAEDLDLIGEGKWFYGAGRVFPDRIEWTTRPVETPDPRDTEAIKTAWDLIPAHVMSDPHAWPLRKKD